ncbi:MAG: SRPBCC family protein [Solirubrobacterales bacterium]|nr:SRPBCC family protein [Solirubrobacterales bacterium]
MYGRYETIEDRPALSFERRIPHPVEKVWEAITKPSELEHWFPCRVEVDLRVGGRMTFAFPEGPLPDGASTLLGEVTELDPPRRFAFTWGGDHLHFELEPIEDGAACLLRFAVQLDMREKAARDAAGWHACLDALQRHLDAADGADGADGAAATGPGADWRARYDEYQRRGLPVGAPIPGEPG